MHLSVIMSEALIHHNTMQYYSAHTLEFTAVTSMLSNNFM